MGERLNSTRRAQNGCFKISDQWVEDERLPRVGRSARLDMRVHLARRRGGFSRQADRRYGPLRRAAPPQTHRQIGEPNTEPEPSTIERAAAEPEHGTGQPDACDPEAFLAPLFGRCVHISQNVAGD